MTVITDANGAVTHLAYDGANRLTQVTYPDFPVSYAYNSVDNRTAMTDHHLCLRCGGEDDFGDPARSIPCPAQLQRRRTGERPDLSRRPAGVFSCAAFPYLG
ncbi:MAG: RHS repeat protein [Chloroflexi bacterium]|nr:RHS repeat protein [Chloroflexota bacterium]